MVNCIYSLIFPGLFFFFSTIFLLLLGFGFRSSGSPGLGCYLLGFEPVVRGLPDFMGFELFILTYKIQTGTKNDDSLHA